MSSYSLSRSIMHGHWAKVHQALLKKILSGCAGLSRAALSSRRVDHTFAKAIVPFKVFSECYSMIVRSTLKVSDRICFLLILN